MADTSQMLRLILHAAARLADEDPLVNAREIRRISIDINTIEAAYRRAASQATAMVQAKVVLRMVAACLADEPPDATPVGRWEDPPATTNSYDWAAIGAELVTRPGDWRFVAVANSAATAGQMAKHIRTGAYEPLRVLGTFDAKARTIEGEPRVYACYVGQERQEGQEEPE